MKKDVSINQAILELCKYVQVKYETATTDDVKNCAGDIIEYFLMPIEGAIRTQKGHCAIEVKATGEGE